MRTRWKPSLAAGWLKFIAEIEIVVFGFGIGLGAFGEIDAKCPYPKHLYLAAGYEFFLSLPWPLPDIRESGKFEKTWKDGVRLEPPKLLPLVGDQDPRRSPEPV